MRTSFFSSALLIGVACFGASLDASAQNVVANYEQPGSLLIYPIVDNTRGALTLVTVTNTSPSTGIFAHFIYVNADTCLEFDRSHYLSAFDTLTVRTGGPGGDNPNMTKGYLYAFAKQAISPTQEGPNAVKFDHLIGQEWVFDGMGGDLYELNTFTLKAGDAVQNELSNTDVSPANGERDLNGHEYNFLPDTIEIPRFFGQFPNGRPSDVVLISLTGGSQFMTLANLLIYDNNENQFSSQVQWHCWKRLHLSSTNGEGISSIFDNSSLALTAKASETAGTGGVVCGWFSINGAVAFSSAFQIADPAVLAVLLDSYNGPVPGDPPSGTPRTAALPFGEGSNTNGRLLSHSLSGD
jgi:hypothetical protein